ncbi:methyltransferase [Photorhabdus luminescens]|uniref:SAM-dependent methyltransferase n=1 Tax=Photorhabdus luminescens subsp. mexicana TaxID=2100167 RepID=A0A4R4IWN0_PHOLU|nr:methyltransferase [Photorhabdus luminescens]TDB45334.1 SAM-dependent methyltransferase [Photorhabdus luminescens subsp. mexicana]
MQVSNDIIAVLSSCIIEGSKLILNGQLDRSLYIRTNKVLEAAGGKWNRKMKAHIFDGDAEQRIDEIILTGSVLVPKDDFNFFPTPVKIIERMVNNADIQSGKRVLEPSCGDGRIVKIARAMAADANITAIELDGKRVELLKVDPHFIETNATLINSDFLTYKVDMPFDVILMNPPFKNKADIKHTNHALDLLAENGRLRGILSAGVLYRSDALTVAFRERVERIGGTFTELEEKAFKESGTLVRTVLLEVNK